METITACENVCRDFGAWWPAIWGWLADVATVFAVVFAYLQVRDWRRQQIAIKAQDIAGELLVQYFGLRRHLESFGSLPDRNDKSLGRLFSPWTADWFYQSAKNVQEHFVSVQKRLDEIEMLLEKMDALDREGKELEVLRSLRDEISTFGKKLNSFLFSAELHRNLTSDGRLSDSVVDECDQLLSAAHKVTPSREAKVRDALSLLTDSARRHLSLG